LVSFLLLSCAGADAAVEIENALTAEHVRVPGLDAYFIPVTGMSLSERFNGFATGARKIEIIVADIKVPYMELYEKFTDSVLKDRGIVVGSRGSLTINGSVATLLKALHADGDNKWGKWIMLLDDGGDGTIVANGVFVSGDSDAAKDVEAMLKSVVVKKDDPVTGHESSQAVETQKNETEVDSALSFVGGITSKDRMVKDEDKDEED
jgi:acetaldehyde dehydrogenase (acetylating)